MSFYDYGQTVGDGTLGSAIGGAEKGFTFSQGVRSMLQKRKQDALTSADDHTAAQQKVAMNNVDSGLSQDPTPPAQPQPSLLSRVGHGILNGLGLGGSDHDQSSNNVGAPTGGAGGNPFHATGKPLRQIMNDADHASSAAISKYGVDQAQLGENTRSTNELSQRMEVDSEDNANKYAIALLNQKDQAGWRQQQMEMSSKSRQSAVIQKEIHSLDTRLSGMWGQAALDPHTKEALTSQRQNLQRTWEQVDGVAPGSYSATTADPSEGGGMGSTGLSPMQPQPQGGDEAMRLMQQFPQYFGGKHPAATDPTWVGILRKNGKIP